MTRFTFQGTGQTTGSGGDIAKLIAVGAGVLILSGGGGVAAAAAGIAAALVDLLYWVAGTIGCTAAAAGVLWFATRHQREVRRLRAADIRAVQERAYHAEVEARRRDRAAIQAQAQAQAWAPLITAIAAAVSQQAQSQPQSVQVVRGEVER